MCTSNSENDLATGKHIIDKCGLFISSKFSGWNPGSTAYLRPNLIVLLGAHLSDRVIVRIKWPNHA